MYSMVPQNVWVTAPSCICSLHNPKSVNLIWPSESNKTFSGFKSLKLLITIINSMLYTKIKSLIY